jgi:hypothetical protein
MVPFHESLNQRPRYIVNRSNAAQSTDYAKRTNYAMISINVTELNVFAWTGYHLRPTKTLPGRPKPAQETCLYGRVMG